MNVIERAQTNFVCFVNFLSSFVVRLSLITVWLGVRRRAKPFMGGPVLLSRLSPANYHRNHYPDDACVVADWLCEQLSMIKPACASESAGYSFPQSSASVLQVEKATLIITIDFDGDVSHLWD
jgi:hypothetical protein